MESNISNASNVLLQCHQHINRSGTPSESLFMATIMFIIIMVSIFGNTLVLLAVYRSYTLRTVSDALLCSLAVSDLLSPILRLLPIAVSNVKGEWGFSCQLCSLSCAIGTGFSASSIFHLLFVSVERFMSIRFPLKHDVWFTRSVLVVVIVFIWTSAVTMVVLPYVADSIQIVFSPNIIGCEVMLQLRPYLSLARLGIYFGIPLFLMVFVYSQVFRAASLQTRRISFNTLGDRNFKRRKIFRQHWKAAKVVVVVVGMFFVLWSPYFITSSIEAYAPYWLPYWIERTALCCAYTNSCCNWVIYSVLNKKMRKVFGEILRLDALCTTYRSSRRQFRSRKVGVAGNGTFVVDGVQRTNHVVTFKGQSDTCGPSNDKY